MSRAVAAVVLSLAVTGVASAAPEARGTTPTQLLTRHAPVLVLHPDERFAPVPVDGFLADSDLQVRSPDGTWQASIDLATRGGARITARPALLPGGRRSRRDRLLRGCRAGACSSAYGVRRGVPHP